MTRSSDTPFTAGKNYLDLTIHEFLDAITEKQREYVLEFDNKSMDEALEVQGTISQFESIIKTLENTQENKMKCKVLKKALHGKPKYCFEPELSETEVYKYLKNYTENFETELTKVTLNEIEVYKSMDFFERIEQESLYIYEENKWEIPYITCISVFAKYDEAKTDELITVPDYKTMLSRTHPCDGMLIHSAIVLLKDKLKSGLSEIRISVFPTKFNVEQLKTIYSRSVGLIKCSEKDFMYWFAGIGDQGNKIEWKKMWGNDPNLAALRYYCKKLNPKIKPATINRVFDPKVDSNNISTNEFKDIDTIFNNL